MATNVVPRSHDFECVSTLKLNSHLSPYLSCQIVPQVDIWLTTTIVGCKSLSASEPAGRDSFLLTGFARVNVPTFVKPSPDN